jgi:hypothetical protein
LARGKNAENLSDKLTGAVQMARGLPGHQAKIVDRTTQAPPWMLHAPSSLPDNFSSRKPTVNCDPVPWPDKSATPPF